jgi:RHS repeat-associated protein
MQSPQSSPLSSDAGTSRGPDAQGKDSSVQAPAITLPKGGGAIRGMGEKFAANPVTGTGSMTVPIATSPGRSGFGPQLSLSYDSGAGNGPFGLGWNLSLPAITRKTDKGLPQYRDAEESDVFLLSASEDLVPVLVKKGADWIPEDLDPRTVNGVAYRIKRYRPRIEGLFARIERWTNLSDATDVFWRSISKDNITTWYGKVPESRIADPADPTRIFSWLICESYDDKGNVIVYRYKTEDSKTEDSKPIDRGRANEANRSDEIRKAQQYLKRIHYGNHAPYLPRLKADQAWPKPPGEGEWYFEVVLDYGEHDKDKPQPSDKPGVGNPWPPRSDPFSSYRAGFEVRTYRLCRRVLMFHHFPDVAADPANGIAAATGYEGLVRATEFTHKEGPLFSFMSGATQSGFKLLDDGSYLRKSLPPLEFSYSEAKIESEIHEVDPESVENLPMGLDGSRYQWVDLDGEGLSGILTEQAEGWFYKRNLSPINFLSGSDRVAAQFAPLELVASKPALNFNGGRAQFLDLAGDGQLDLATFHGPTPGFYERTQDEGWEQFVSFESLPVLNWDDPNLKFVDLSGDGHADVLITEDEVFRWYPSLGEGGFGPAETAPQFRDEEKGPTLVFADGTQSIYLADLSGDGLSDLARVRNGEVCYWPNLGYGRFGAKVTMDDSPWFDLPDQFDQKRVRLADVDGSGTTDILYLASDRVDIYHNQSGNSWSSVEPLANFPAIDNLSAVQVTDLLGNGTACLVWSSPLPGETGRPMRYVDLLGGQKPHLLIKAINNLGAETEVQYAPSTKFYLADKRAGKPWITRLPFPVHCVENVTVRDRWRKTEFSTTYSYHHGYFDGVEREFRGFGRIEELDVESYGKFQQGNPDSPYITADRTLYQPPIKTVTWYHTGAFLDRERILTQFQHEYFPHWLAETHSEARLLGGFHEVALPQPDVDAEGGLTANEWREALRACKGMVLRQEVCELDVDALENGKQLPVRLFSTAYHNCHIRRLQPKADTVHAVFLVGESETLTFHYELDLMAGDLRPDPRIAHTLNLKFDEYANVLQSLAVTYPRLGVFEDETLAPAEVTLIRDVQKKLILSYTETRYTEVFGTKLEDEEAARDNRRLPLPCQVRTYELTLPGARGNGYLTVAEAGKLDLSDFYRPVGGPLNVKAVGTTDYHRIAPRDSYQKRLVEHQRTLFFHENLFDPLPFAEHGRLGLIYENYRLALTEDLLDTVFIDSGGSNKLNRVIEGLTKARDKLDDPDTSGYLSGAQLVARFAPTPASELTGQYWIRSGIAGFAPDAIQHFYLPERYADPFGNVTRLEYDSRDLFLASSSDARENTTEVTQFDFRVLAPRETKDINDNLSEVFFDVLGLPSALAVKGKGSEADSLAGFTDAMANPLSSLLAGFFDQADLDEDQAHIWLGDATARHVYHFGETVADDGSILWGAHPACACAILREQHVARLPPGGKSLLQTAFEYSDGMGSVLGKKVQAEPLTAGDPLRWIATGKTVLNNKGKPVKQYEPYFSPTARGHRFEEPVEVGVTPIIYYDAAGRTVRTEMPDGSFSRVEFSPWHVRAFDQNDTAFDPDLAKQSDWYKRRTVPAHPRFADFNTPENARAAESIATHANTPALTILDSLGRDVISIVHNRLKDSAGAITEAKYFTFTKLDAEGKPLWIRDARKNLVMQYITPPVPSNQAADPAENFSPCYDIVGNLLFQQSMDAGPRWMLNDAAGKPMLAWDFNERQDEAGVVADEDRLYFTRYDALHRPSENWLKVNGDAPQMIERFEYLDAMDNPDLAGAKARNLCGQLHKHFDSSGLRQVERIDFKGSPEELRRQLAAEFKAPVIGWQDGSTTAGLSAETFVQITEYDALKRMTRLYNWHRLVADSRVAVYEPRYSRRGLLESEDLVIRGTKTAAGYAEGAHPQRTSVIKALRYDAKGQKERADLGNGTVTRYFYDSDTFRLRQLRTTRPGFEPPFPNPPSALRDEKVLQNLHYTYDPIGNITEIRDDAYEPAFFQNQMVEAVSRYTYDALYRLARASGRENGAAAGAPSQFEDPPFEVEFPIVAPNALRNYTEEYRYDPVGNIEMMRHQAGPRGSWTRLYTYAGANNRLLATQVGDNPVDAIPYRYDTHGNMLNLARVAPAQSIRWGYHDMIHFLDLQGGGRAYYTYTADKQRTRKRLERLGSIVEERFDLGGLEISRKWQGGVLLEEIESIHLVEGARRTLLVDDILQTDNARLSTGPLYRYQCSNHLGSATLESDHETRIISYEEYHPYGTTAYQTIRRENETSKRYRYTGKERDDETGMSYHVARYYLPWLGRWLSADPIGIGDGLNLYIYSSDDPVAYIDVSGTQAVRVSEVQLQRLSPTEVQTLIVAGGGSPGLCYENPTFEQRQRDIGILRDILTRHDLYSSSTGVPVVMFQNENQVVLMADSRGNGYIGPRSIVTRQIATANLGYQMQVGENIRGGLFGAIGYGLGGERGSYAGAVMDGLTMAAGGTAAARQTNRAISATPPPSDRVTQEPVRRAQASGPSAAAAPTPSAPSGRTATAPTRSVPSGRAPAAVGPPTIGRAPAAAVPPATALANARAFFNLSRSSATIVGVLIVGEEQMFIRSGEHGGPWGGTQRGGIPRGPGYGFTSGGASQGNIATHVEGHVAAIMHQRGIVNATLYVESNPCQICSRDLMSALPAGSTLTVVSPGRTDVFRSSHGR